MSLRYDLSGVAGFDQSFPFELSYAGGPLNLTGYTVTLILKATATAPDALGTTYTEAGALTITSATQGQFTWVLPGADTALFSAPGSLWYRVDVTAGEGDPVPAMYGALWLAAA